jgi:hypothetical protein
MLQGALATSVKNSLLGIGRFVPLRVFKYNGAEWRFCSSCFEYVVS